MDHDQKPEIPDDKYARESFTFRRMKPWQTWGITIAAIVILLLVIAYAA
jgi:hypothetical protein